MSLGDAQIKTANFCHEVKDSHKKTDFKRNYTAAQKQNVGKLTYLILKYLAFLKTGKCCKT